MFKDFLMKTALKAKGVPEEQINVILKVVEKNPELFQKIAQEIGEKVKQGKTQEAAAMEVMMSHSEELKQTMQ